MRFVPQLIATLAMSAFLGAMAAPVNPKTETDMMPSDLQYAGMRVEREGKR
jgi:hypothetical protein